MKARIGLFFVLSLLGVVSLAQSPVPEGQITTVPIEYRKIKDYPLVVIPQLAGTPVRLSLSLGDTHSILDQSAFLKIEHKPELTFETALGTYTQTHNFQHYTYHLKQNHKQPTVCGVLASDYFAARNARVTLDFVKETLTIDSRPQRPRLQPSPAILVLPLHHGPSEGAYAHDWFVPVKINQTITTDIRLDTDSYDLTLTSSVWQRLIKGVKTKAPLPRSGPFNGPLPVSVQLGSKTLHTKAYNIASESDYCGLDLSILSQFRVTIDYRDKMLYLEPPSAPVSLH